MNRSAINIFVNEESSPTTLTAPEGYEFTGEYRRPQAGEWYYETRGTKETKVNFADRACWDYAAALAFILRPILLPKERRAKLLTDLFTSRPNNVWLDKKTAVCEGVESIETIFHENPDEAAQ